MFSDSLQLVMACVDCAAREAKNPFQSPLDCTVFCEYKKLITKTIHNVKSDYTLQKLKIKEKVAAAWILNELNFESKTDFQQSPIPVAKDGSQQS